MLQPPASKCLPSDMIDDSSGHLIHKKSIYMSKSRNIGTETVDEVTGSIMALFLPFPSDEVGSQSVLVLEWLAQLPLV